MYIPCLMFHFFIFSIVLCACESVRQRRGVLQDVLGLFPNHNIHGPPVGEFVNTMEEVENLFPTVNVNPSDEGRPNLETLGKTIKIFVESDRKKQMEAVGDLFGITSKLANKIVVVIVSCSSNSRTNTTVTQANEQTAGKKDVGPGIVKSLSKDLGNMIRRRFVGFGDLLEDAVQDVFVPGCEHCSCPNNTHLQYP